MLHIRLLVPTDLYEQVLALLDAAVGVTNISVMKGAARSPAGDLVELDAAREAADDLLDALTGLRLDERGSISVEQIDLSVSRGSRQAQQAGAG